jgi:hypothetical protein
MNNYYLGQGHFWHVNYYWNSHEIPAFYEIRRFITVSQEPATCPYAEPDQSILPRSKGSVPVRGFLFHLVPR